MFLQLRIIKCDFSLNSLGVSYGAVTEIANFRASQQSENASLSGQTGTIVRYENLSVDGIPLLDFSRGAAHVSADYVNAPPSRYSLYERLQLFRSLAAQFFRNTWGSVDEHGRHVYDVLQRNVGQTFVSNDKLGNTDKEDTGETETSSPANDTFEASSAAMMVAGSEDASTRAIV